VALVAAAGPWAILHGTLAGHMLQHLVVMNIAALLFALALRPGLRGSLAASTVLQIVLLWGWHVPPVFEVVRHHPVAELAMQGSLLAVAFVFWGAVLAHPVDKAWQTILATLVTAKAFCMFGAILCFSRRLLYPAHGSPDVAGLSALDDQQLAGLFMVASCTVVYVAAAVALFLRWLDHVERETRRRPSWRAADA
jgi:putative membrane protein